MARISMITPAAVDDPEVKSVYDQSMRQWGTVSNFSQILAHSPSALQGWLTTNSGIRMKNVKIDPEYVKIQQMLIVRTSTVNQSAYCLSHNVDLGKSMGLSDAQLEAVQGDYASSPLLTDKQKAAIRWAEAVTTMKAHDDDQAFADMKKHFTERQIVELTVFCGMWNYSNRLCEALHVDLEPPEKRIKFQSA